MKLTRQLVSFYTSLKIQVFLHVQRFNEMKGAQGALVVSTTKRFNPTVHYNTLQYS